MTTLKHQTQRFPFARKIVERQKPKEGKKQLAWIFLIIIFNEHSSHTCRGSMSKQ
jgi:hypothetical protein